MPAANQTSDLAALTGRLQAHVRHLAGEIGERNVFQAALARVVMGLQAALTAMASRPDRSQ
ncbi:hypothetical protein [Polaromonas sp.]|uniref:hypothetical protein n=1 Tax=Polaromonas sp. TaxID=1869339 RepID=UPI002FC9839E